MKNIKTGFIGCGEMASAIIKGIIKSKFINPNNIIASKSSDNELEKKSKELGIKIVTENKEVVKFADIIFIATKPSQVEKVLKEISLYIKQEQLIVSIAAGIKIQYLSNILPQNTKIIRVMPNTPILVGEGISAIIKGQGVQDKDLLQIKELFETIGKCVVLDDEGQMDVVTAISGSGPAFFYKIINEIAYSGEKLGLDYEKALLFATQTALGSSKMIFNKTTSMEDLIKSVTTSGGCTEVGIESMDKNNSAKLFNDIIRTTTEKVKELGKITKGG